MNKETFLNLLQERILLLDGGMGTMIQGYHLTEADYRGERFASFPGMLKGNNDLLSITRPDVIRDIHRQYLDAGADIFTTNTFNANAISMEDYGMSNCVREMNLASARLGRELADSYMKEYPEKTIFVAGSVGPTNKTASMSPDVSNPAYRAVTYRDLYAAYKEQVEALVDGGVDIILFETTFDTLNAKAGLEAAEVVLKEKGVDLPIMLSLTLAGQGGRTLSGQTLKAFLASVQHTHIVSVGLNLLFLPHFGFIGAAIVSVLTESLVWLIQLYYTRHYLKEVPIIGAMTKIMFASAVMYGLLLLIKPFLHFTPTLNVLVYAVLGGIIYLIAILSLRVVDVKELKQQFLNKQ